MTPYTIILTPSGLRAKEVNPVSEAIRNMSIDPAHRDTINRMQESQEAWQAAESQLQVLDIRPDCLHLQLSEGQQVEGKIVEGKVFIKGLSEKS